MLGSRLGIASLSVGFSFAQLRDRHVGALGLAARHWASTFAALGFPFGFEGYCFPFDFEGYFSLGAFASP